MTIVMVRRSGLRLMLVALIVGAFALIASAAGASSAGAGDDPELAPQLAGPSADSGDVDPLASSNCGQGGERVVCFWTLHDFNGQKKKWFSCTSSSACFWRDNQGLAIRSLKNRLDARALEVGNLVDGKFVDKVCTPHGGKRESISARYYFRIKAIGSHC